MNLQPLFSEHIISKNSLGGHASDVWLVKTELGEFVRTRFQAYLDFEGNINYMEYVTKPKFELKMKKTV